MSTVHVHIEHPTSRARYAVEQVLGTLLGWRPVFHADADTLQAQEGSRLVYGVHRNVPGAFHVNPAGLLQETGIRPMDPSIVDHHGLPLLFPVEGGDLTFDPFAAAFFLLTRYEELTGIAMDAHGRPLTDALHGARHGYLHRPVVDEWALLLAERWRSMDPALPPVARRYRQVCTIDLDNGFKYLGRPFWRVAGALLRDALNGRWNEVSARMRVLRGRAPDPYDVYADLADRLPADAQRVIFFVLSAPHGPMDHAVPVDHPAYRERLKALASWAEVGVHPSYTSSDRPGIMQRDALALERATGVPVRLSRQHFLRMRLPHTFREAEALNIAEEHSMGLHDRIGFRAGTCTPYAWYDPEQERTTALTIHPFAVMDNALCVKLGLTPGEAVARTMEMLERIRAVHGTFTGLWHEAFLGRDAANGGWREAILHIIHQARP